MKRFPLNPIRLDKKEFNTDLGNGNTIFIGSSCDMFAEEIPDEWIFDILEYCNKYKENTYVFQSKNPLRFIEFEFSFPDGCKIILGTTIETNYNFRSIVPHCAPSPLERKRAMQLLKEKYAVFLSIEPVMKFDVDILSDWIKSINPEFVSIGADSQGHGLPEPTKGDIEALIESIKSWNIEVKLKDNLRRIIK
jgi:DNA repair photolyase